MKVLRRTDLLARRAQQHGHPLPAHRLFGLQGRRDDRRRHAARHHDGVQASGTDSHGPPRSGSASPGCSALTCPTALRQETRPPGQGHEPAPTRPIRRDPIAAQYNQMIKYAAGSAPEPPSPRPSCANRMRTYAPALSAGSPRQRLRRAPGGKIGGSCWVPPCRDAQAVGSTIRDGGRVDHT